MSEAEPRDQAWFEVVSRRESSAVRAYSARRSTDPAEVFAAAWRRRDDIPDPSPPWLLRTAHNQLMHAGRSAGVTEVTS